MNSGQLSCFAYSQRGQIGGEEAARIGQPQSLQFTMGSPNIPRTSEPQRRPPQGPVPTPVRLPICSKVLAPAWMALRTAPLRILLHRQAGLRLSMTACSLAFCSSSSMVRVPFSAILPNSLARFLAKLILGGNDKRRGERRRKSDLVRAP